MSKMCPAFLFLHSFIRIRPEVAVANLFIRKEL